MAYRPFTFSFMTYKPIYSIPGSPFQHIKFAKAFKPEKLENIPFCLWHIGRFIFLFMAYGNSLTGSHG